MLHDFFLLEKRSDFLELAEKPQKNKMPMIYFSNLDGDVGDSEIIGIYSEISVFLGQL